MAKRITISIPDELYEQIQVTKNDYGKPLNASQICQKALSEAVLEAEAHEIYKKTGYQDGLESFPKLSRRTTERIAYVLNGDDPDFQNSSIHEIVDYLEGQTQQLGEDMSLVTPKHNDLYEGITVLHRWLKYGSLEDKRGKVSWSYIEGWYLGVKDMFFQEQEK